MSSELPTNSEPPTDANAPAACDAGTSSPFGAANCSPRDQRNGVATAALIVGLISLAPSVLALVLGPLAAVLGLIGVGRAYNLLPARPGRLRAWVGLALGITGGALAARTVAPWRVPWNVHQSPRLWCASNLRGIGQGMLVYANDNNDSFPVVMFSEPPKEAGNATAMSFIGRMGADYKTPLSVAAPGTIAKNDRAYADPNTPNLALRQAAIHPSRSLFQLVIDGSFMAGTLVCPLSGDIEDDLSDIAPSRRGSPGPSQPAGLRFDLRGYRYLSYGYQIPYGRMGQPSCRLDPNMIIAADKGPYFKAGKPRPDGTVPDAPTMTPGSTVSIAGGDSPEHIRALPDAAWRPLNSRNHGGTDQNVLWVDGHVACVRTPIVGIGGDNIYTMQGSGGTELDILLGRVPADRLGPMSDTDSVLVP